MGKDHRQGNREPAGHSVPDERKLRALVRAAGRHPRAVLHDLFWRYRMHCLNESLHFAERALMSRAPAVIPVRVVDYRRPDPR